MVDKKPSRLPQAFWFKIKGLEDCWQLQKMGTWISLENIIGGPLIYGSDKIIKNASMEIESLNCALVSLFGRKLVQYKVQCNK